MNILILGGDGFIGSHLAKAHAQQGDAVYIVDIATLRTHRYNDTCKYIHCDVSQTQIDHIIKITKPDFAYNCVAIANPSYYVKYPIDTFNLDFKVNYENVCQPLISHKVPFVQFSTSEVYGKKWESVYAEDTSNLILGPTHKPRWIYAASKILLEQLLLADEAADCTIIRPQNFIGWDIDWLPALEGNDDKTWIPRLPACFLNNLSQNLALKIVEPGSQRRCYTDIEDGVTGTMSLVSNWDAAKREVFNIGNPDNEISVREMAGVFMHEWAVVTGRHTKSPRYISGEAFYGKGYEDCERRMFSYDKINQATGWTPKYDINQTVNRTVVGAVKGYKLCE